MLAAGLQGLAALRADRWLRRLAQGRGVILMFHRVRPAQRQDFAPNRVLEITPEFLDCVLLELRREGFDIIPLEDVPSRLQAASDGPRPFAALTFDDGYRDNAEHARPVLKRHGAAWTIFVTAEFAEGRGRLWWIELEQAVAKLNRVVVRDAKALDLPTRSPGEKHVAFATLHRLLRAGSPQRLSAVAEDLAAQAGIDTVRLTRNVCLSWDEIRALACDPDVTIGAHTVSHPALAKHDADTATREIADSRSAIERQLGRPVRHFSYPFGDRSAAGLREFRLARGLGFATAVTSRPGHVFPAHADQLHALPRVSVNGEFQNTTALRVLLSGAPFLAWTGGRGARVER